METKRQNYTSPNVEVHDLTNADVVTASTMEVMIDPWEAWENAGLFE